VSAGNQPDASRPGPERARVPEPERLRRWRLLLGRGDDGASDGTGVALTGSDAGLDATLAALYDAPSRRETGGRKRAGGLGGSAPGVARWLGDVRRYFPASVVQVLQRDAIDRLDLRRLLLEPEMVEALEPDIHLVGTLLALRHLLPDATRATARQVVATVVAELEQRLAAPTHLAVRGALARASRTRRPQPADIDWDRTIRANLRHYQPALGTIVPEHLIGYTRRASALRKHVIVALDQSASMAESIVYAAVFGAALASVRALRTDVLAFDTSVVDLSSELEDPVDLLFGVQLGGGTDLGRALGACHALVSRPADTLVVLVSDLYDGGPRDELLARAGALVRSGVTCVALLALSDEGAPAYDRDVAAAFAALDIAAFACTPDAFPDLLATALEHRDVGDWAARHGFPTAAPPLLPSG
jgi:Mg-chelatase subunit ChlD